MKDKQIIGITGGIGSGKSTILNFLKDEFGAHIIEADKVGHKVMEPGQPAYKEIVKEFGPHILTADGSIDRMALGNIVFNDENALLRLNNIVHPQVKAYIQKELEDIKSNNKTYLIFVEAALLIEEHYEEICDQLWYIYVDVNKRFERVQASRNMSKEKFDSIVSNQLPDDTFRAKCNIIIDNSGDFSLTKEQLHKALD